MSSTNTATHQCGGDHATIAAILDAVRRYRATIADTASYTAAHADGLRHIDAVLEIIAGARQPAALAVDVAQLTIHDAALRRP